MGQDQIILLAILTFVFCLFLWERWRFDVVAFLALVVSTLLGLVPPYEAFTGFGHPATITVASVLIISRALMNSGAVEFVTRWVQGAVQRPSLHVAFLSTLGGLLSTMMNNVGALALLMPVALQSAAIAKRAPAILLMPLSFATILGGLVTLIGTPANIIVATYRGEITGTAFQMFDFAPVGGVVALVGVIFVAFFGWHLIPKSRRNRPSPQDLFEIEDYVTEIKVPEGAKVIGQSLNDLEAATEDSDALIVRLIRGDRSILGAAWRERIQAGDVLIVEAGSEKINTFANALELDLPGQQDKNADQGKDSESTTADDTKKTSHLDSEEVTMMEAVVPLRRSCLVGQTPRTLRLRTRYGITLMAVSRQGQPYRGRLKSFRFQPGDVLLLQGESDQLSEVIARLGCLPLAQRRLSFGRRPQAWFTVGIFVMALASAISGLVPLPIALAGAAVGMVLFNIVPTREVYEQVDWPVIILIGAMIPVAGALVSTGTTALIASALVDITLGTSPAVILGLLLIITMILSDVINNTATAVVMAPIGLALAQTLNVTPDPFFMAVAIGASCAFLTPVGHQNNMLIMGPGGYHFGDYWRMGLVLEILIVLVTVPMLLWVWPL